MLHQPSVEFLESQHSSKYTTTTLLGEHGLRIEYFGIGIAPALYYFKVIQPEEERLSWDISLLSTITLAFKDREWPPRSQVSVYSFKTDAIIINSRPLARDAAMYGTLENKEVSNANRYGSFMYRFDRKSWRSLSNLSA